MPPRSELQLCDEIVIAKRLSRNFDESTLARIAGRISRSTEIGVTIRPNHDVSTQAALRAGIERGRF